LISVPERSLSQADFGLKDHGRPAPTCVVAEALMLQ